jgi:hypothetical protein
MGASTAQRVDRVRDRHWYIGSRRRANSVFIDLATPSWSAWYYATCLIILDDTQITQSHEYDYQHDNKPY